MTLKVKQKTKKQARRRKKPTAEETFIQNNIKLSTQTNRLCVKYLITHNSGEATPLHERGPEEKEQWHELVG